MSESAGPSHATSPPTSPLSQRHRRSKHVRSTASLTSGMGPPGIVQRRASGVPIFESTGFDPMRTEPDALFVSLSVKEVETYQRAILNAAQEKQQELRHLVGQSYQDLLGTANTIIDMADSSNQLLSRLDKLTHNVRATATTDSVSRTTNKGRRLSFLPVASGSTDSHEHQLGDQEMRFALGASLKLIMDAPEYVWRSIEKGKSLQAAWAYMLARAAWFDINDPASSSVSVEPNGTAKEASSKPATYVKQTFPFIEKQWHSMLPMRKQILQRATSLLADADIEHMAVTDQLCTLMLLDGVRTDRAFRMFLSQRQSALRRVLHKRPTRVNASTRRPSASLGKSAGTNGQYAATSIDASATLSTLLEQLIKLFARTLQHAFQIFILPHTVQFPSSPPLLHALLINLMESANTSLMRQTTPAFAAPVPAGSKDQLSPAAVRAAKRKSSYGMPTATTGTSPAISSEQPRQTRVSTRSILEALPSGQVLSRLLPFSVSSFTPHVDLEEWTSTKQSELTDDICKWSASIRTQLILGQADQSQSSGESVKAILEGLSGIPDLASIRRACRASLLRVRRVLLSKFAKIEPSASGVSTAASMAAKELDDLGEALEVVFRSRLKELVRSSADSAVQSLVEATKNVIVAKKEKDRRGQPSGVDGTSVGDLEYSPIKSLLAGKLPSDAGSVTASEASRLNSQQLSMDLLGRTPLIQDLVRLYEAPVSVLRTQVGGYVTGLAQHDQQTADNIQSSSLAILSSSLAMLVEQLREISRNASTTCEEVPFSVTLILQLIAIMTKDEGDAVVVELARETIKSSLRQCWQPIIAQRMTRSSSNRRSVPKDSDSAEGSERLLLSLSHLSESILQLGPCLICEELAEVVISVLTTLREFHLQTPGPQNIVDLSVIENLLARDEAELHPSLRKVSVVIFPLLSLLKKQEQDKPILMAAEPVSLSKSVPTILQLASGKARHFQPLPSRY